MKQPTKAKPIFLIVSGVAFAIAGVWLMVLAGREARDPAIENAYLYIGGIIGILGVGALIASLRLLLFPPLIDGIRLKDECPGCFRPLTLQYGKQFRNGVAYRVRNEQCRHCNFSELTEEAILTGQTSSPATEQTAGEGFVPGHPDDHRPASVGSSRQRPNKRQVMAACSVIILLVELGLRFYRDVVQPRLEVERAQARQLQKQVEAIREQHKPLVDGDMDHLLEKDPKDLSPIERAQRDYLKKFKENRTLRDMLGGKD